MKSSPKSGLMRTCSAKGKLIWTSDLCDKFQKAIEKLGIDNAVPKKILELMKVKGLTRDNVASHLQKYRIVKKRLAASSNGGVVITSKPALLESSMTDEAFWMNDSLMLNQQPENGQSNSGMHATNLPILDTSSTYVPVVEASDCNATFELAYPGSLSIQGNYSMQDMSTNLDKQRNLINDASYFGVANSMNSSSGFVQNHVGFTNSYGGYLGEVDSYNNIEMDSSSGVQHWNNELEMTWNHEKQIIAGNSKSSYFVENPGSAESNYSSQSEFVEMDWMHGSSSRDNMKNDTEHDLIWNGAHLDYLLSCGNDNRKYQSVSNNLPVSLDPQAAVGEDFLNDDSFDSYQNKATSSIDPHQTLDGYLHDFDHTSNMNNVTPGPPNQDVNDQNCPNIIPFGSNAELTSVNAVQTTDGNLPPCDQTFHMNNATLDSPNQDANGEQFLDNSAFASNEATSIDEDQTLAGFLSGFDSTYNMDNDELIEPIWSPEPITDEMIRQGYF